ncbi:MAG: helix-turn-helix domain-containing protein [Thermodesulfobacteriota bacterium]
MTSESDNPATEASSAPEPTETLGSILRRARQDRRVALEIAAKETRIHTATLKALEEDARTELPAEVFTRGFIKIYAQYLGLNPDEMLRLYLQHRGEKTAIPDEKVNVQEVLAGEAMADPPSFHAERHLFTAAVVILVSLILYLGYKITAPPETPIPPPQASAPLPAPQPPPAPETMPAEGLTQQELPAEGLPTAPAAQPPAAALSPAPQGQGMTTPAPPMPTTPPPAATAPRPVAPAPAAQATPPKTVPAAPQAAAPATVATPLAKQAPTAPQAALPKPVAVAPQATTTATPTPTRTAPVPPPAAAAKPVAPAPAAVAQKTAVPVTPAPTAATKPPLKELAPPGPIKKEKADKVAAAPTAETEKPAREPSTAEKLIAAIKPMRPPYALEATFREDTWVRIQVDGEKPKPQYFKAGDRISWHAGNKIHLFIGNAGGVDLVLNNTKLPPLGKPGNTTRISIQPQPDQR